MKIKLFDKDYRNARKLMKYALKSKALIRTEQNFISDYWKCDPAHYIRYELFNKRLTKEQLLDYIPPYYMYNYYNKWLYSKVDRSIYDNKFSLYKLFKSRGVPTPKVYAIVKNGIIKNENGEFVEPQGLFGNFQIGEKIFFKPVLGKGGTGIFVLRVVEGGVKYLDRIVSLEEFIECILPHKVEFVVQKGIIQRADFSKINSSSVNTLRVIVQFEGETPRIRVAVLRIGRNGKDVDNSHQGGISVKIDTQTGCLHDIAFAEHGGDQLLCHPDTGYQFSGSKIGAWNSICEEILEYSKPFLELREFAWDVAVTDSGVKMIELNLEYGISHLQCCCGGMRRILNVFPI